MKRISVIICLLILFQNIYSENNEIKKSSRERKINMYLPGYYQISDGRTAEGCLYMASIPLLIAGQAFGMKYVLNQDLLNSVEINSTIENEHYFLYYENYNSMPNEWMWFAGNTLTVFGTLLYSYSQYDAFYNEGLAQPDAVSQIGLFDMVSAPWHPENIFNLEVFPILTLEAGYSVYSTINSEALNNYFNKESVSFLGRDMSPSAALGSVLLASTILVSANATWEEIMFRGTQLQSSGIHRSSIQFGLIHSSNASIPNVSIEDTLYQIIFATAFGYYAGNMTQNNNYDFRKSIAFHFWHNIIALTTNYILEPDNNSMFSIQFNYSF